MRLYFNEVQRWGGPDPPVVILIATLLAPQSEDLFAGVRRCRVGAAPRTLADSTPRGGQATDFLAC